MKKLEKQALRIEMENERAQKNKALFDVIGSRKKIKKYADKVEKTSPRKCLGYEDCVYISVEAFRINLFHKKVTMGLKEMERYEGFVCKQYPQLCKLNRGKN
jgi:hypothetical protein